MFFVGTVIVLFYLSCGVSGHGMLFEPPSRSSAWRFGFPTPVNNDDNALFCGGSARQQSNGGRCGVCGDPWDDPIPRKNEAGGIYGKGVIVRNYTSGQVINVRVQITANHRGWMEFRLCPNNDITRTVTHECLNRHLLSLADGSGTRYYVTTRRSGYYDMQVKLPDGLTCSQCVFQWKYHAGNSWGRDPITNEGCVGCGPQEEFYGCADVAIRPSTKFYTPPPGTPLMTHGHPIQPITNGPLRCWGINAWANMPSLDAWCTSQCGKGNCPRSACACDGL